MNFNDSSIKNVDGNSLAIAFPGIHQGMKYQNIEIRTYNETEKMDILYSNEEKAFKITINSAFGVEDEKKKINFIKRIIHLLKAYMTEDEAKKQLGEVATFKALVEKIKTIFAQKKASEIPVTIKIVGTVGNNGKPYANIPNYHQWIYSDADIASGKKLLRFSPTEIDENAAYKRALDSKPTTESDIPSADNTSAPEEIESDF